jgi:predicted alpha/beta superfamily hydrolase
MLRTVPIHVYYPPIEGDIVLRTDADWDRDVVATSVEDDSHYIFEITTDQPFVYFKPGLRRGDGFTWAVGTNNLLITDSLVPKETYPFFFAPEHGIVSRLIEVPSQIYGEPHKVRGFLPPGYEENTLKRFPVLYMQDGNNLFLAAEASFGTTWSVTETLELMGSLRTAHEVVVVGIWPDDRLAEYTLPGYERYGRFVVEELKPAVDERVRTLPDRHNTAVMGSSLGGVVSFYLAWQYPEVFGMAACMSSTFGYADDLRERVAREPKRDVRFYLDSGVPGDNYEVTKDMYGLLLRRGYQRGEDVLYFSFPAAEHAEQAWATRSHLPYQFFFERM